MKMRMSRIDMNNGAAAAHSAGFVGAPSAARALFQDAAAMIDVWRARYHDRRAIRRLDDHMLRDIGLDRFTADEIGARPFWKA